MVSTVTYSRAITKERMAQSTEEAMVPEATQSVNDPQNGSKSCRFHQYLREESKIIPSLLFHCRHAFCAGIGFGNTTGFFPL